MGAEAGQAAPGTGSLLETSAEDIGWLARRRPAGPDVTARFLELYADAEQGPLPVSRADRRHVILFVPGIFTERYPFYFHANIRHLRKRGFDVRRVEIDTDETVAVNAEVIHDSIQGVAREGRRVILIGHSKGPLDIAAALALYPGMAPWVRAFVSMQAAYAGTPLASDLEASPLLRSLVSGIIRRMLHGAPQAYWDLSYKARQRLLSEHPALPNVPIVSLVTSTDAAWGPLEQTRRYMAERYGVETDGFVPVWDAAIPGSRVVHLRGVDHAGPALLGVGNSPYRAGSLTEALVALALEE